MDNTEFEIIAKDTKQLDTVEKELTIKFKRGNYIMKK